VSQGASSVYYLEMQGKIALVTGGSSGIGLATAAAFAHQGATVVVASRDEKRATAALEAFGANGKLSWLRRSGTCQRL